MKRIGSFVLQLLRRLPLLLMAAGVLWLLLGDVEISFEALLRYTPQDMFQAALFLWLAFAVKSLSVMCPVLLIFAVTGYLFPLPIALLINAVGISITVTLPYLVGRLSGPDLTERLMKKYPRIEELRALRRQSSLFLSFIVRPWASCPATWSASTWGTPACPIPSTSPARCWAFCRTWSAPRWWA